MAIPFVLLGDAPDQPSGLSRIATDLAARIYASREAWGIDFLHLGADDRGPLPERGIGPFEVQERPTYVFEKDKPGAVVKALNAVLGRSSRGPMILFTVWDPARCFEIAQWAQRQGPQVQLWGYFPIDGENRHGVVAGPAAAAMQSYRRVLAYGPYGMGVIGKSIATRDLAWLPHGVDREVFYPRVAAEDRYSALRTFYGAQLTDRELGALPFTPVLGCVAANTARKDFPLYFAVLAKLRANGTAVRGWLHTNVEVSTSDNGWSVPQLAEDFNVSDILTVTTKLTDTQLACAYSACTVTLAPGRGEGFGYPILESMSCGTPVVGYDYAGGGDLLDPFDVVTPYEMQLVGPYAIQRPVSDEMTINAFAAGVATCLWDVPVIQRAQLELKAETYAWPRLWPQWHAWISVGIEAMR